MSRDFERAGHKSIELLRYYIKKDINSLEEKLCKNEIPLIAYLIASLVDISIVTFFNSSFGTILEKALLVIVIIITFDPLGKIFIYYLEWRDRRYRESGRSLYEKRNIYKKIDEFDNVACDGLLICDYYRKKYNNTEEKHLKDFYFYEILHYMKKINIVFLPIYTLPHLYISNIDEGANKNIKLIKRYRIHNFITFITNINKFLQDEKYNYSGNTDIQNEINLINEDVNKWPKILH